MKPTLRNIVIGIVGFVVVVAFIFSFFNAGTDSTTLAFSDVIDAGRNDQLKRIEVRGDNLDISFRGDSTLYESKFAEGADLTHTLLAADVAVGGVDGVEVEYQNTNTWGAFIASLIAWLPVLVFPFVIYFAVKWGVREALKQREAAASSSEGDL